MADNFLRGDRDQPFLLPPDLRDWLPAGHLAWFVLDVVDQLDLEPFYRAHRDDGHGHPAYDPKLLLGVLLYGYCLGVRSSRQIERRCHEDIAFRVLAANQTPDHVTIARFRARHEQTLAGFLVESLKLCAAAGMVQVGTVTLDGTKLAGNASDKANRTQERLEAEVAEILRQAAETDQREDRLFGDARGDELPPQLASKAGRLARLRQAKARLEAEATAGEQAYQQRVAAHAAAAAAKGKKPRQLKRRPQETPNPEATANTTDPDSRFLHTRNGTVQGYNAQAVTTLEQVIVAAELADEANDVHQLEPMLKATAATLAAAGIDERPEAALADSGYWSIDNLTEIEGAPELLIPPARHGRQGKPRKDGKPSASKSDGLRAAMTAKLKSEDGKARYAKRRETVEPVFGQIKEQQGARRFMRRGMRACQAEWKLLCGTHNLLKLWRHTVTPRAARPAIA
ncbi:MAG TPA: transposase [Actinomycetes bacterium]|nr:transposase [Actinomycetes bacterium]